MCLNYVRKIFDGRNRKVCYGYKTFRYGYVGVGSFASEFLELGETRFPNVWYRAKPNPNDKSGRLWTDCSPVRTYPCGFHAFVSRKSAVEWADFIAPHVRKVKLRGILAVGEQNGRKIIVAREMMILPEKEDE